MMEQPVYKTTLGEGVTFATLLIYRDGNSETYEVVVKFGDIRYSQGISKANVEGFETAKHQGVNLWRTIANLMQSAFRQGQAGEGRETAPFLF